VPQRDPDFDYLAHDLSQLLWAIQGRARTLAARLGSEEAASARAIAEDAQAAAAMLASGEATAADPVAVVRAAWRQARDRAAARGGDPAEVTLEGPTAAPAVAMPPAALRRILGNLLANAVEAMPDGGAIRWEAGARDDRVVIAVRDTGRGVPPDLVARLFEAGATAGKPEGHGLGLAGSRALARRYGGDLVHVAAPGRGACFELVVPPGEAEDQTDAAATAAGTVTGPLRILVADDEAPVREMLAELLASEGHEGTLAADADAALARWTPGGYHAALIDLGLPGRDGAALARSLREKDPTLALVMLTGWGRERELASLEPGLVDFTATKPIDLPQLRQLLHRAASLTAARRGVHAPGE
jgi:CheY-like chemotaxis protein